MSAPGFYLLPPQENGKQDFSVWSRRPKGRDLSPGLTFEVAMIHTEGKRQPDRPCQIVPITQLAGLVRDETLSAPEEHSTL